MSEGARAERLASRVDKACPRGGRARDARRVFGARRAKEREIEKARARREGRRSRRAPVSTMTPSQSKRSAKRGFSVLDAAARTDARGADAPRAQGAERRARTRAGTEMEAATLCIAHVGRSLE